MTEARNREVFSALALRTHILRSRAKRYKEQATELFHKNDPVRAYRALGQADEIAIVIDELDRLRFEVLTGEPLATLID